MTQTNCGAPATAPELDRVAWRKSTRSPNGGGSSCVELGPLAGSAGVAVRDTKDREGGVLVVADTSWIGFLGEVKRGAFDLG
jgi:uncharacterized protein DUF397